jgi:hypothetical protein
LTRRSWTVPSAGVLRAVGGLLLLMKRHISIYKINQLVWFRRLESSRPKPGRMEETPKGGRGPPWAVAPLERERERERERESGSGQMPLLR